MLVVNKDKIQIRYRF